MFPTLSRTLAAVAAATLLAGTPAFGASPYPAKPIHWVVGTNPGGATDIITRLVARSMSEKAGVPIVIDNRPGGATSIAAAQVARAAPDGHTVLSADNGTLVFNTGMFDRLAYDPDRDFVAVGLMVDTPLLVAVRADSPIRDMQDLLARAKAGPRSLDYATPGIGSPHHLAMEMLKDRTATDIVHIPYVGMSQAVPAVLGGHVAVIVADAASGMPQFKEGKLRPLASFSAERLPMLPEVPTLIELGLTDIAVPAWIGAVLPAGTDPAIVATLSAHLQDALATPEVRDRLTGLGLRVPKGDGTEMNAYWADHKDYWISLIRDKGIKAQ